MNDHLILILRLDILPGRNYKDIINIKLVKILLPVIHPVYILCLRLLNRALTHVQITSHLFQFSAHLHQDGSCVLIFIQIKRQISLSVIFRHIRQYVYEHLLFVSLSQRYLILNLYPLDSQIHQHTADNIFCFCCRRQTKLIPLHQSSPFF